MPCSTFPISPIGCPILDIGLSSPLSAAAPASTATPPPIHWFRALADTGCSHTAIHASVAQQVGLQPVSQGTINSTTQTVAVNIYLADLFLRYNLVGRTFEFAFRNRLISQLHLQNPDFEALLGMDLLGVGMLVVNGPTGTATFCW